MTRRVLLYEINEVPWEIWDLYVVARPQSNMAQLLDVGMQRTTVNDDEDELLPWRSWPTFHYSSYTADHNAYDQGQDPASFRGTPVWDVVDAANLRVGMFGALQTWPPRPFAAGGFYVPDTFARTDATVPATLRRFQAFNLSMTQENGFAPKEQLAANSLVRAGADMVRRGLGPSSAVQLAAHLARERRDRRYLAARPSVQVLPCFDVFWRQHRSHEPHLSIFFTNHVASMMHRFWGDWVPGYDSNGYEPDPVYRTFILRALDYFDRQLGVMRRWIDRRGDTVLILATSMGQGPIAYHDMPLTYVLEHPEQLAAALGYPSAEAGLAMYPRVTLQFADHGEAERAVDTVASVTSGGAPLFRDIRVKGTTVSFLISFRFDADKLDEGVTWVDVAGAARAGSIRDLGVVTRERPGGGNTAQHTRDGVFVAYGAGIERDPSRDKVTILDAAPSILDVLGLEPAASMQGAPSIFR